MIDSELMPSLSVLQVGKAASNNGESDGYRLPVQVTCMYVNRVGRPMPWGSKTLDPRQGRALGTRYT